MPWARQHPTWRAARPAVIAAAVRRATARPSGNWYVLGASADIRPGRPFGRTVAGTEVVAWRGRAGRLLCGPGACPHLGAPLCQSPVVGGKLLCHWHGLALGGDGFPGWTPYPAYDDGVLAWVRLDAAGGGEPLPRPVLPSRPSPDSSVTAVTTAVGTCEPEDVLANRLDPWHGTWFHPYAFTRLSVLEEPSSEGEEDRFLVDVAYRLGRASVPVRAVFTAPEPRTVVMRIVEGEGTSSVVETHATPLGSDPYGRPRTAVVEAVIATSDRSGFAVARRAAPLLRPLIRHVAARLWRDDLAYAERRRQLLREGRFPG
ncbi:2Fe-2S ferredoxin [Streptomyces sp. Ru87]|uniref:Rieske (2Fe-2S) protein n=1 Tax=Streptomyces lycii TaxID=2654337 RepID=A0ABQ7FFD5_9ACTN|nr:Rieske (2Fe-2S) protein [Streptomyces lycii]PGH52238.1 2Fe-2S ferredoxin [Streptomyces sp. Ru87]